MDITLVVLAAGMGSRYGGLKQIDSFGPNGETILDYSIYDAIRSGFTKVVFVIRNSFKKDFMDFFTNKFENKIKVRFVSQELDMLPAGINLNSERKKPWGTGHAVWVTKNEIDGPFAVINADDFYGLDGFKVVMRHFENDKKKQTQSYSLVGYKLVNTLSNHGTVNRGVCQTDVNMHLQSIEETLKIGFTYDGKIAYPNEDGTRTYLKPDTTVSMNLWAFYPSYFDYCTESFSSFLQKQQDNPTSEYYIPILIEELIRENREKIHVLTCDSSWFGVTYLQDKPIVKQKLIKLIEKGIYPHQLWT